MQTLMGTDVREKVGGRWGETEGGALVNVIGPNDLKEDSSGGGVSLRWGTGDSE